MRVTKDNIVSIDFFLGENTPIETSRSILTSLLFELEAINTFSDKGTLFINYEDKHTEYSPERTDPCPDYYGCFSLRWLNEPYETVGDYMTLNELDGALLILSQLPLN